MGADFTLAYGMAVEDAVGKRHTLQLTIKRDRISSTKKKKKGKGEEDTEKVYTLAAADEMEYERWLNALQRSLAKAHEANFLLDATASFGTESQPEGGGGGGGDSRAAAAQAASFDPFSLS